MRKLTVFLAVVALATAAGVSAAGAGESGNLTRFCRTNVAVDAAPEGPTERLAQRLLDTAPPEIAPAVETAVTLFQEQGEAAFEDEAFNAAIAELDQFVLDNCDFEQIDVTMEDYAFSGLPDEVERGTVAFNLTNEGTELHEFAVLRLKGDATLDDILDLPEDASEEDLEELAAPVRGGGFAEPGASDLALIRLRRTGDYVAVCFIPVGTTPEAGEEGGSGPPHFTEGMAAEFEVTD